MIYFFFSLVFLMLKTRKKTESVLAIFPNIWTTNILHKLSFLYILLCQNRFHSGYYYCHSVLSLSCLKAKSRRWLKDLDEWKRKNFLSYTVFCAHVTFFARNLALQRTNICFESPIPLSNIVTHSNEEGGRETLGIFSGFLGTPDYANH